MKLKSESVGTEERGIKLALEVSSAKNHFVLNRGQSTHTIHNSLKRTEEFLSSLGV